MLHLRGRGVAALATVTTMVCSMCQIPNSRCAVLVFINNIGMDMIKGLFAKGASLVLLAITDAPTPALIFTDSQH